ncbi:MAG: hypothetical protein NDI61_03825, partial [Bdellovibrionaceae bacterium]|nr:hypothetical protein [Pseudobdellovibrionaceae bacterium]
MMKRNQPRYQKWILVFTLTTLYARTSHTFDFFPEFGALDAVEAETLDSPQALDSESQSDVLTYMPDLQSDAAFFSRPMAFELALGSLSAKQFLHYQRVRLSKMLSEGLELRFTHWIQRDLEEDRERQILELLSTVSPAFGVSLYGIPSREKEEIDLGVALLLWPRSGQEIRMFHTWTDVVREERSQGGDRFVSSQNPNSIGLSSRLTLENEYATFGFRRDLPG